jgi:hypothetical protein
MPLIYPGPMGDGHRPAGDMHIILYITLHTSKYIYIIHTYAYAYSCALLQSGIKIIIISNPTENKKIVNTLY